jgi:hypothetical protein
MEDLLGPPPQNDDMSRLKGQLLDQTLALLPASRRWRRLASAAALAACFALGMMTMWLIRPGPPAEGRPAMAHQSPTGDKSTPADAKRLEKGPDTALAKEWQAFDSKQRRADLFVQAGDQYLQEGDDVDSALRCYRQGLASASPQQLTVQSTDNWLVMALKTARRKEINHAQDNP